MNYDVRVEGLSRGCLEGHAMLYHSILRDDVMTTVGNYFILLSTNGAVRVTRVCPDTASTRRVASFTRLHPLLSSWSPRMMYNIFFYKQPSLGGL